MRPGTVGAEWENGSMSTNPQFLLQLEFAQEFFKEMGMPFAFHVDPLSGEFHAWAVDDVDLGQPSAGARSVPKPAPPARRRRGRR